MWQAGLWVAHRPWLAAVAAAALVAWIAGRNLLASWRHRRHATGARLVTIAPPPQVDPHSSASFLANLAGILTPSRWRRILHGIPHVAWQYTWSGRQLLVSVWVPGSVPNGAVEAAVRGAWPGAACTTTDTADPIPAGAVTATGGRLSPTAAEWLPLRTDHDTDPLRALMAAGAQLRDGEYACVQVLARPASPRRAARARRAAGRLRDGTTAVPTINPAAPLLWLIDVFQTGSSARGRGTSNSAVARRDPSVERDVRAVLDKTSHVLWETGIRYAVASTNHRSGSRPDNRLRAIADAIASSFAVHSGRNRLAHRTRMPHPVAVLAARRLGPGFLTAAPELAALAALPQDLAVPGLDRARAKSMPAPVAVPTGGRGVTVLGDAEIGGHPVALAVPDARYHMHMVGSTGSGKTTLLANMIIDGILAGRGTVVIDPHGDLVTDILDRLPASVADRVVLFDPDQPNPPTLNPLEGRDHDLITDNLVSIFGSIFERAWGPRMDDVMRVSCLTLLKHANVTLQHIPPLLTSAQFRSEMTVDLNDPEGLDGFWSWYDEMTPALRSQVIGPVLARLRAFLLRDFVKRAMRYPRSSFDMGDILDGGVLLVRIPKGMLGEDTSRLLGSLILAKVWQAATARASIPVEQRRDAQIVLDECQNFLTLASSLDTMLAEARKYRLSMVLAHQDLAQFPRDLLAAVSANARNKVYFSVSPEDARVLARHTTPELDEHDLAHLNVYTAVARLVVGGRQTPAFTMRTRPPRPAVGEATAIRHTAAQAVPQQETSAVDDLVARLTKREKKERTRRKPAGSNTSGDSAGSGRSRPATPDPSRDPSRRRSASGPDRQS
ncbi:type IV secretion system DNA-binding domain-containing protein [Solwaraspora sp. WMMD1047]|uniref:type IV secretory system conjugative DNA transfer family protein n=1 Tax=Solwaraspora sp. WMMD1047 TaxID=3016102 RepID=UPI002415A82D|nr:type IV secretion system DNA-binding domain-containing protein [Solwaraspora sp. WMMD1047]MDG4834149.1 type IV secretion system DNA-binding domain-containing protein [Solwaraspora sp. WMMD1047]